MSPLQILVASVLLYLLLPWIFFRIIAIFHHFLVVKRYYKKNRSRAAQKNAPDPLWPRISKRIKYIFQDNRKFTLKRDPDAVMEMGKPTNRMVLFIVYISGAVIAGLTESFGFWKIQIPSYLIAIFVTIVGMIKSGEVLKKRDEIYQKMLEIGRSTLNLPADSDSREVINVMKWHDTVKPEIVRFNVPATFNADGSERFLQQFNQTFGNESTFVPMIDKDKKIFGWEFDKGYVTIKENPPLPKRAEWSEKYVLDDRIAWSFFPLALGIENGVELIDPETGEKENVLGFDVSGLQVDLAKEKGLKIGEEITTSPMALIAGATGGGKALSVNTPILVKKAS